MNSFLITHRDRWDTRSEEASQEHAERYRQLDQLIQEGHGQTVMDYNGELPEASVRARLYLDHLRQRPETVLIMLFRDDEGAQQAWTMANDADTLARLGALLDEAGWRIDSGRLVRSEAYYQHLQAYQQTIANDSGAERNSGTPSQGSHRSNGSPSVHTLSFGSQGQNGGTTNELATFLSHQTRSSWLGLVQQIGASSDGVQSEDSPDKRQDTSDRAVVDEPILWTGMKEEPYHKPQALVLLSADGQGNAVSHPGDLNNSQTHLNEIPEHNPVAVHQNPQHIVNTHFSWRHQCAVSITRCCNWIARKMHLA